MARYIDADALVKELERYDDYAIDIVNDQPTADVVEVVRCKECKYSHPWYADRRTCEMWSETGASVFNDDYCSRGERRTDDEESTKRTD